MNLRYKYSKPNVYRQGFKIVAPRSVISAALYSLLILSPFVFTVSVRCAGLVRQAHLCIMTMIVHTNFAKSKHIYYLFSTEQQDGGRHLVMSRRIVLLLS